VAYSPAESILASASEDGTVRVWNAKERQPLWIAGSHDGPASAVSFSPDGKMLASTGMDQTVRLWKIEGQTGPSEQAVIKLNDMARRVLFSPDGQHLAVALEGNGMVLLDVETREKQVSIFYADYNSNCVRGIAFTPDSALLAMASLDGAVRLWKTDQLGAGKQGRAVRVLREHESGVTGVAFSADGLLMATASHDGTARLWAVKNKK
jgi:WD40 repeat protein